MASQISEGKCHLCGDTFSKSAMTKHLKSCKQKKVDSKTPCKSSQETKIFHLVVEDRGSSDYWMHLEVPADAKLEELDGFLRRIWLECCGHLSAFRIEGKTYSVSPMEDFDDESMEATLDDVLSPGLKFCHEYDFGSTTYLELKVVSLEQKQIEKRDITVLARNEPPSFPCVSCGKMATHICTECIWSGEGCLCDECASGHECGEDMLLPVVNSPRVGVCGYTGQ